MAQIIDINFKCFWLFDMFKNRVWGPKITLEREFINKILKIILNSFELISKINFRKKSEKINKIKKIGKVINIYIFLFW